jgi:hypothetical protein
MARAIFSPPTRDFLFSPSVAPRTHASFDCPLPLGLAHALVKTSLLVPFFKMDQDASPPPPKRTKVQDLHPPLPREPSLLPGDLVATSTSTLPNAFAGPRLKNAAWLEEPAGAAKDEAPNPALRFVPRVVAAPKRKRISRLTRLEQKWAEEHAEDEEKDDVMEALGLPPAQEDSEDDDDKPLVARGPAPEWAKHVDTDWYRDKDEEGLEEFGIFPRAPEAVAERVEGKTYMVNDQVRIWRAPVWKCQHNRVVSVCKKCYRGPAPGKSADKTHPALVAEWDPSNTHSLSHYSRGCKDKVKWICATDSAHTWKATISLRTMDSESDMAKCPHCVNKAKRDPSGAENNEQTAAASYPAVPAKKKNRVVGQRYCLKGHVRVWGGRQFYCTHGVRPDGCPPCQALLKTPGTTIAESTDLSKTRLNAQTHPLLAIEWGASNAQPMANYTLGSGYKADWVCSKDSTHKWNGMPALSSQKRSGRAPTGTKAWNSSCTRHWRNAGGILYQFDRTAACCSVCRKHQCDL